MLKLTLLPEEYLLINDSIVVQLKRVAGGRVDVAIEAPREFPIVRGAVLERNGGKRPDCLAPPSGKKAVLLSTTSYPPSVCLQEMTLASNSFIYPSR